MFFEGREASIRSGDFIQWEEENNTIVVYRGIDKVYWDLKHRTDSKGYFRAVKTKEDFADFVAIVGNITNLKVRKQHEAPLERYQFV